jgi:hypothetical protein
MTDDIATRLRELANMGGFLVTVETMFQAAAEIERLRADMKELLQITKLFADYGKCLNYEEQWGYCTHSPCDWHDAEHMWESFCMSRGL